MNPNSLEPYLLPHSLPILENPNSTFTNSPFLDYQAPSNPLFHTSYNFNLPFQYPIPMHDNPLNLIKTEGETINIGLNLGQRTYFNTTRSLFGFGPYNGSGQNPNPPRCQVDGCKTDLTGSKHYHRRHKVCEFHSKAPMVLINGLQQRFCQQCSRFHVVAEFDEAKRSCRKRLADHNRRRRKPVQLAGKAESSLDKMKIHHDIVNISAPKSTNDMTSSISSKSTTSMSSTSVNLEAGSHAAIFQNRPQTVNPNSTPNPNSTLNPNSTYFQRSQTLPFVTSTEGEKQQHFLNHQDLFYSRSYKGHAMDEADFM
ncbi:hypothetical protein LUZ60_017239 [Juncus effusus]|nr:hypothetical protein LUZ60_017239 [Juncus effusus]